MSCDFGVWFPHARLSNREAGALYVRLCNGDTSGIQPHPAVDAFYSELTAMHPEIDTVFIVTDSEKAYREMIAGLKVKNTFQLYRDYLDNFRINARR